MKAWANLPWFAPLVMASRKQNYSNWGISLTMRSEIHMAEDMRDVFGASLRTVGWIHTFHGWNCCQVKGMGDFKYIWRRPAWSGSSGRHVFTCRQFQPIAARWSHLAARWHINQLTVASNWPVALGSAGRRARGDGCVTGGASPGHARHAATHAWRPASRRTTDSPRRLNAK